MAGNKSIIAKRLMLLGASGEYLGYNYLIYAISMCLEDMILLKSITTCIYPQIAKEFSTTSQGVERCIRTVIANIWDNGNKELLLEWFGNNKSNRPTNAHFLAVVTSKISFELELMEHKG